MLSVLLESPRALATVIVILLLLDYRIRAVLLRCQVRQSFVEQDVLPRPRPDGKVQVDRARLTWPFILGIVAISLTLSADPVTREFVGGGYLVLLLAGFALNIVSFLSLRPLLDPAAAEGRVRLSAMCTYRTAGAHTFGLAFFTGAVGIFFGSLAFIAGTLFLLAVGIGYYRRARRESRTMTFQYNASKGGGAP